MFHIQIIQTLHYPLNNPFELQGEGTSTKFAFLVIDEKNKNIFRAAAAMVLTVCYHRHPETAIIF